MAVKKIIQIGHPALKAENKKISDFNDPKLRQLVKDLKDTMIAGDLIGIAAPQLAKNFSVFVTQPRRTKLRTGIGDELRIYINPVITIFSDEESIIFEGCGSVLNGQLFGPVKRPKEIIIQAYDLQGKKFKLTCDGILARVIQHEYDHLSGVEFLEKISDYKQIMNSDYYRKKIRKSRAQVEASKINIVEFKYV